MKLPYNSFIYISLLSLLLAEAPLHSAFTVKSGKIMNKEDVATMSVQEHYSLFAGGVSN